MTPEELAPSVLRDLANVGPMETGQLNFFTYCNQFGADIHGPVRPPQERARTTQALAEALAYLQQLGMIAPNPAQSSYGWIFVTRRGREAAICRRAEHPRSEPDRRGQTAPSAHPQQTQARGLLRLDRAPVRTPGVHAHSSVHPGVGLCQIPQAGPRGVRHRSGCPDRHQPSRARAARYSHGQKLSSVRNYGRSARHDCAKPLFICVGWQSVASICLS